jgi:hypothetical protein
MIDDDDYGALGGMRIGRGFFHTNINCYSLTPCLGDRSLVLENRMYLAKAIFIKVWEVLYYTSYPRDIAVLLGRLKRISAIA